MADKDEAQGKNKFDVWTPRLLRAAYNYQIVAEAPGAYAHNAIYVIQILHDSLVDLGSKASAPMGAMARP